MEELLGGKVIFNVEQGVKVGEESPNNVSTIFEELILSVRVGK